MENNTNSPTDNPTVNNDPIAAEFETRDIYLKDASFESPSAPHIFIKPDVRPAFDVQVETKIHDFEADSSLTEIVVITTVTAKFEDTILYLAETHQAGLFRIKHPDPMARQIVAQVTCPHILLAFAREALNDLITKGGFNPYLINQVNFDQAFRSKIETASQQTQPTNAGLTH